MCVGKKTAFLGENVMSKKREHMLAMRCGGQGWISQKVDGYYLICFNTEIGFLYSGGWKMLFMFLCQLKYCHYDGTVQVLHSGVRGDTGGNPRI